MASFCFLLGTVFLLGVIFRLSSCDSCPSSILTENRVDCHPDSVSDINQVKTNCENRGCQWCESTVANVPWCFHKTVQGEQFCSSTIPPNNRIDCYPEQVTDIYQVRANCEQRGCQWCESSVENVPWCFYPGETFCSSTIPPSERIDCHPEQITDINQVRTNCEQRRCYWCESHKENVPWCFYKTGICHTDIDESSRQDCMSIGAVTKERCENRACMYCETSSPHVPWCFFNGTKPGGFSCPADIPEIDRIDCYPNPTTDIRQACVDRGCFFCESQTQGIPWCFYDTRNWKELPVIVKDEEKVNCVPEKVSTNDAECRYRGCDYIESNKHGVPWCFVPPDASYDVSGDVMETATGYRIRLQKGSVTMFGESIQHVNVDVEFQTNSRVRVKFTDANNPRFEVPLQIKSSGSKAANPLYDVQITKVPAFAFKIVRKDNGQVIFDTSIGGLVMENQFLQIATRLPSNNVYGFGMHQHYSFKHDMNFKYWGMWSRDQPPADNANLYSVHPFYECVEVDGKAHGVLFLNSNAQDVLMQPAPSLTYRTTGGILDIYVFLGPTPENVISQYTEAIGRPFIPPYWSLGFSLAKYGYHTLDNMKNTINKMRDYDIPHDYQFGDIDYMDRYLDFTYNKNTWAGYPEYIKELQQEGIKTIIILDPAIATGEPRGGYPPFDEADQAGIWVKRPDNSIATGKVWPQSNAFFPDFFHPAATAWWVKQCKDFKQVLNYDGIWIDMNEPANFVWGDVQGCPDNKLNKPPYFPQIFGPVLYYKTLCPDHKHHIGNHYDVHSLYGWSEAEPTFKAAREATGKRSIVLSRSTFPGAGKFVATWLGDNWSYWSNLKFSVIGMLEFNLFGMPLVGADICGFIRNAEYEMCMRWQLLGAFYPFSRNHNLGYENRDQDPTVWGDEFAKTTRDTLHIRYTLLPYLYTLFYRAHVHGETVVRALFHEFPSDSRTWKIDEQFLWGKAFMVSPVLHQGATRVSAYFPGSSDWYSYYDGTPVSPGNIVDLNAPLNFIPLHIRGGFVLPTQSPGRNTLKSRQLPMGLIVALDTLYNTAYGEVFWDDGESIDTYENGTYFLASYSANETHVQSRVVHNSYPQMAGHTLATVRVFGNIKDNISEVQVNSVSHTSFVRTNHELTINGLHIQASTEFTINWK